jgi:hypothetical protein
MTTDHARFTDPVQSDETVKSLGKDTNLKSLIYHAVLHLQGPGRNLVGDQGVTDDEIWAYLESTTGRRFQRNVLARTRGLMANDNLIYMVADTVNIDGSQRRACRVYVTTPTTDPNQETLF